MHNETTPVERFSNAFGELKQQDPGFFEQLSAGGQLIQLGPHQVICEQGLSCTHLALVISGTARVYKLGESGREITLYRIHPGESCILTASCILSEEPFPAIAVSETPMEALIVPSVSVNRWLSRYPAWQRYVFSLVSRRLGDIISVVEEVTFRRVDSRIIDYLLGRSELAAEIHATHQEIASELGTSREVVSRILKDLENAQLISTSRGKIRVLERDLLLKHRRSRRISA